MEEKEEEEKEEEKEEEENEEEARRTRRVLIRLWLSGDYKWLCTVCGHGAANSKHACIFCDSDLTDAAVWCDIDAFPKWKKGERPKGQKRKNLFGFIPRTRYRIDVLHMLLRCVDRFIHTAALLVLRLCAPTLDTDNHKKEWLNKHLAPEFARLARKTNVQFNIAEKSTVK